MSRHLITLYSKEDRDRAKRYAEVAPVGTRVEFKAIKRSLPQNDLMWAMLTDIAAQKDHGGRKYTPDQWKIIFMHAVGREVQFIPSSPSPASRTATTKPPITASIFPKPGSPRARHGGAIF